MKGTEEQSSTCFPNSMDNSECWKAAQQRPEEFNSCPKQGWTQPCAVLLCADRIGHLFPETPGIQVTTPRKRCPCNKGGVWQSNPPGICPSLCTLRLSRDKSSGSGGVTGFHYIALFHLLSSRAWKKAPGTVIPSAWLHIASAVRQAELRDTFNWV